MNLGMEASKWNQPAPLATAFQETHKNAQNGMDARLSIQAAWGCGKVLLSKVLEMQGTETVNEFWFQVPKL